MKFLQLLIFVFIILTVIPTLKKSDSADHYVLFNAQENIYDTMSHDKAFGKIGNITFWIAVNTPFIKNMLHGGEYLLKKDERAITFLSKIVNGKSSIRKITFPEGYTVKMIVEKLYQTDFLVGDVTDIPEEGTVFPSTYYYKRNDSRNSIIAKMKTKMNSVIKQTFQNAPADFIKETIILASLIEKETRLSSERPIIASVFRNRMKIGMRLQSDPTVIYAMSSGYGKINRNLTRRDLKLDSDYNTYRRKGLPPTPICCPSLESIDAALNPAETKFFYFVLSDDKITHKFHRDYRDHMRDIYLVKHMNNSSRQDVVSDIKEEKPIETSVPETIAKDAEKSNPSSDKIIKVVEKNKQDTAITSKGTETSKKKLFKDKPSLSKVVKVIGKAKATVDNKGTETSKKKLFKDKPSLSKVVKVIGKSKPDTTITSKDVKMNEENLSKDKPSLNKAAKVVGKAKPDTTITSKDVEKNKPSSDNLNESVGKAEHHKHSPSSDNFNESVGKIEPHKHNFSLSKVAKVETQKPKKESKWKARVKNPNQNGIQAKNNKPIFSGATDMTAINLKDLDLTDKDNKKTSSKSKTKRKKKGASSAKKHKMKRKT